jgi:hypothetical protein
MPLSITDLLVLGAVAVVILGLLIVMRVLDRRW